MTLHRFRACATVGIVVLLLAASAQAATPASTLSIEVDRERIETSLGTRFAIRTRVTNVGSSELRGVLAHLNVLSLDNSVYVDPEDWSARRTVDLGAISVGATRTTTWSIQAINPGSFGVYVAVLPARGQAKAQVGPVTRLDVAGRRTLDAGGILPLALGIPLSLGGLALVIRRRRKWPLR